MNYIEIFAKSSFYVQYLTILFFIK